MKKARLDGTYLSRNFATLGPLTVSFAASREENGGGTEELTVLES